jgi:aryl-alcohol dehydrogenase-like predicted oxidoreductase
MYSPWGCLRLRDRGARYGPAMTIESSQQVSRPGSPALRRQPLGSKSGLSVTDVGLGLWAVPGGEWGPAEDADSLAAIEAAFDAGVNFFDTADVYGAGHSEELLGRAMAGRRDQFIVATKIGWTGFDRENDRSQYDTVDKLVAGVAGSLERLGTDYVDVIQCHISYAEPNTDVFIEGFHRLKESGTVRAWGVSTGDINHLRRFNADDACDTLQIDYSILNRFPEREIFPYCQEHEIGVIVRGPLAMGLLSGKYRAEDEFPVGDFRRAWTEDREQHAQFLSDLVTVDKLKAVTPEGTSVAELALRFVRSHPAVTTVIPGARNRRQAESNTATGLQPLLTDAEMAAIDRIVGPGGGRKIWPEVT